MNKRPTNQHVQRQALGGPAHYQDLLPQGNPFSALTSVLSPAASLSIPVGLPSAATLISTSQTSASKTTSLTSTTGTTSAQPAPTSTSSQSSNASSDSPPPLSFATPSPTLSPIESSAATDRTTTVIHSVTSEPASPSPSGSAGPPPKTFLQNKALSGVVFGLVGVVGLILIFIITTLAIRRRRRSKLIDDAISFDPPFIPNDRDTDTGMAEKGRISSGDDGYGHWVSSRDPPTQHAHLSEDYGVRRQDDLKNLWENQSSSAHPLYPNKPRIPRHGTQQPGPTFVPTSTRTRY